MESQKMQWSDELRQKVGEALVSSNLVEVMEKAGILEKGTFEVQINLVDKDYKPTTSEARGENVSSARAGCVQIYYHQSCQNCSRDGGTPLPPPLPPNGSSCWCEFC